MDDLQMGRENQMVDSIREILQTARANSAKAINNELLIAYWNIGKLNVEDEQNNLSRAKYGENTLVELSKRLTREFGKGFSRSNLQNMRAFYLEYENCQTLSGKLSWSHYCELLSVEDKDKRR